MEQLKTRLEFSTLLDNATYFLIPSAQIQKLGNQRHIRLQGEIDGIVFTEGTATYWDIHHYCFQLKEELLKKLGKSAGEEVDIRFGAYDEELIFPADFREVLSSGNGLIDLFESLTPEQKRSYLTWISGSKTDEERRVRLRTSAEMLASGQKYKF